jgi:hypothetical protein
MDTITDHSSTQSAVDEALAPIIENPFSENAGHAIASLWKVIPAMCNIEAALVLDITIQQQNIMLTNSTMWKWLEVVCRENCLSHMVNQCDPDTWIKCLTDRVDNLIDSRPLTSSGYGARHPATWDCLDILLQTSIPCNWTIHIWVYHSLQFYRISDTPDTAYIMQFQIR